MQKLADGLLVDRVVERAVIAHVGDAALLAGWAVMTVFVTATMFDRPITTASMPDRLPCRSRSIIRQPSGVHGTIAFCPVPSSPTFEM